MKTREMYQKKYEAQLDEWSAKLDVLKARAAKGSAQARIDLQPHLESAQTHYERAKARLSKVAEASESQWHEFTESVERGWKDLRSAAEGAVAALKGHGDSDDADTPS